MIATTPLLLQTRRHFFGQCAVGLGSVALASPASTRAAPPRTTAPCVNPLAPKKPHFPAKAKRVIFLFMAGGPSQLELFDHKPKLQRAARQADPRRVHQGQALRLHGHVRQGAAEAAGHAPQVRPARQARDRGSRSACRTPPASSMTSPSCARGDRRVQPRPAKLFVNTGSPQFGRPSMGAWVTYGIGSESQRSAGLRGACNPARAGRAAARSLGQRLPADDLPGRAVPHRRRADPEPDQPAGHHAPTGSADVLDAVRDLNAGAPRRHRRPGDRHAHRRLRDGLPDADQRPGADRPRRAKTAKTLEMYGAEPGKPSFANNCLLARRLVERGVRFVQLYHTDWDHHGAGGDEPRRAASTSVCREVDQPCRRADQGPEAARPARRHAGDLGRRVRPHADGRGARHGRPRPSHRRLHHVAGRRRHQAGPRPRRTPTSSASPPSRTASTSTTCRPRSCTCSAWTTRKLTFRFQGRDFRLTDVHGEVVEKLLA